MPRPPFVIDAPPILHAISNPYALAFSPDGSRLALGSGGWYGGGGLSLIDIQSRQETTSRFAPRPLAQFLSVAAFEGSEQPLTISGVAFDAAGEFLAVCSWSSRHRRGPAFLFRVSGVALVHHQTFQLSGAAQLRELCPTGVCFTPHGLCVRSNARQLSDVFHIVPTPREVDLGVTTAHRSHARVVLLGDELVTGSGDSLAVAGWSGLEGQHLGSTAPGGSLPGPTTRGVPAPGARVTAVLALPGKTLITGHADGQLVAWEKREEWRPVRQMRNKTKRPAAIEGTWATYQPESVVGLCALEDGRFFSVDASGEVLEWRGAVAKAHELPLSGTPRCIAVHSGTPKGPLLAVGVKAISSDRGYIACLPID